MGSVDWLILPAVIQISGFTLCTPCGTAKLCTGVWKSMEGSKAVQYRTYSVYGGQLPINANINPTPAEETIRI